MDETTFNIAELNERVTIQYPTVVKDGMGGETITWNDGATVWAKAWTVSATESTAAAQTVMMRVQKFKIRYRSVLKSSWRLKWGNRYFAITGIDSDHRIGWMYLTCKEIVG
jgi:SPP1 family predicted phage head-tail adaptor